MIVLGIDPGYATIGFGVLDVQNNSAKCVGYGIISTKKEEGLPKRLAIIETALVELIRKYKPDHIAFEELFFFKNLKTAITVAEARGVLLLVAYRECKNLYEYTPLQIKQALTGYGRAEKRQIQDMTKRLLGLKSIPKPDDAADALAVALTHAHSGSAAEQFRI